MNRRSLVGPALVAELRSANPTRSPVQSPPSPRVANSTVSDHAGRARGAETNE